MMKSLIPAVLATLAIQESAELKLALQEKKPLRVRLTVEEDSAMVPGGTTDRITNRVGWELGLQTGGVREGIFPVRVTVLRMYREANGRRVDTAKPDPADPPQAAFMKGLVGEFVEVDLTEKGTVKEVRGLKELEARFAAKFGIKPEEDGPHKGLSEGLGRKVRENVESFLAVHPVKAVKAGAEWTRKVSMSEGTAYHSECRWSLTARKDSTCFLSGKWTLTAFPDADQRGRELKNVQKLSGTGEGTMELDQESGFPVKARFTHQLTGKSTMEGLKTQLPSDVFDTTVKITFAADAWAGK